MCNAIFIFYNVFNNYVYDIYIFTFFDNISYIKYKSTPPLPPKPFQAQQNLTLKNTEKAVKKFNFKCLSRNNY